MVWFQTVDVVLEVCGMPSKPFDLVDITDNEHTSKAMNVDDASMARGFDQGTTFTARL